MKREIKQYDRLRWEGEDCPVCTKPVSSNVTCPNCGYPNEARDADGDSIKNVPGYTGPTTNEPN